MGEVAVGKAKERSYLALFPKYIRKYNFMRKVSKQLNAFIIYSCSNRIYSQNFSHHDFLLKVCIMWFFVCAILDWYHLISYNLIYTARLDGTYRVTNKFRIILKKHLKHLSICASFISDNCWSLLNNAKWRMYIHTHTWLSLAVFDTSLK